MKAVILAGGKGTRLRPFTYSVPKPLLPVHQRPILEHIILHMKKCGFDDFIIMVGHLGYQIKTYFGDGSELGVKIEYVEEKSPQGTAGCLVPLKNILKDTFLVVAGDNLTNLDFQDFVKFHRDKGGVATIVLIKYHVPIPYGIAELDHHVIKTFHEKPTYNFDMATMIYALEPTVLDYVSPNADMSKDVFPKLLADGKKIYGYRFDGFWSDVGRHEDLRRINGMGKKKSE